MTEHLWRAVISQAIADATQPLSTKRLSQRMDQQRCREWFTRPNRDFRDVCELAGLDPERVRTYVRPLIAEAAKQDQPMPEHMQRSYCRRQTGGLGQHQQESASDRCNSAIQDGI